jgi:hypothetical protein
MKIMSCPTMKPLVVMNISFPNPRLEKDIKGMLLDDWCRAMMVDRLMIYRE